MHELSHDSRESVLNAPMKRQLVSGVFAPASKPTPTFAALVALACALPVGIVLWIVEIVWR